MEVPVNTIYSEGRRIQAFPYRLYVLDGGQPDSYGELVVSIPKKLFKRAVRRNLLRRRTKEAFRHIKTDYPSLLGKHLLLVYVSREILDYGAITEALRGALEKI